MTKLRTGLIGCGSMGGGVHAPGLASHPQIELSAIADVTPPNLERVGDEQGIPTERRFAEAEDLAALPDLDLVVVATPPWLRKAPVLTALNAGKHVLAEKPLAAVPQDAWEMVDAAERAERVLAMMHNYLFFPEFEAAKAAIDRGTIGEVQTVSANLLCVPDNPGAATFQPGWRRDLGRAGGGILMDMLHPLYVMSWLASAPVSEVSTMIRRTGDGPLPVDDLAMCHLRLGDVYASLNLGWGLGPGGIGVGGTEGRLWLRYINNGTTPFDRFHSAFTSDGMTTQPLEVEGVIASADSAHASEDERLAWAFDGYNMQNSYLNLVSDVVAAVTEERQPRSTGEDGARAVDTVLACYASAARRHPVALPLDSADPVYREGVTALAAESDGG